MKEWISPLGMLQYTGGQLFGNGNGYVARSNSIEMSWSGPILNKTVDCAVIGNKWNNATTLTCTHEWEAQSYILGLGGCACMSSVFIWRIEFAVKIIVHYAK